MTPDRLDQISRIYHEALSRSEDERDAFLSEACGADQLLRQEIESLLKHDEEAGGFMETPGLMVVAQRLDQLNPGSVIGTYSILSRAGSGGMGDVYHARDMRLGREVAIKCLPPSFATDPARRVRFEREARLLATLNHPNIAQIHGLEDSAGGPALVMEWVPGKTLADVVGDGALPVDRALPIARQIADAIDAAHENGILHRDLKPANIKLRSDGVVKVLDFGLAKGFAADPMGVAQPSAVAGTETVEGTVLGTPGYMSPEQARGVPVDKRTDIWAFGCVIYEMLAGHPPFAGPTFADTLTAVIDRDPAWSKLPSSTPPRLRELLQRCLSKDPASRLRDIGDARLELAAIAAGNAWADPPSARVPNFVPWVLLAAVLGLLVWLSLGRGAAPVTPANKSPVIILMDSPGRAYDQATKDAGLTNADDVSDALTGLPVVVSKENTSSGWHREEWVRRQNPDLIISHLSCLLDAQRANADQALEDHLFDVAEKRLTLFFGFIGATNPRTRFLVYSRGHFPTEERASTWRSDVIARFPTLDGRVHTMSVPGGKASATFRDPATARKLREQVKAILALH